MYESYVVYSTPVVRTHPITREVDQTMPPRRGETITAFQAKMYERLLARHPRLYPVLGPRLVGFYERQKQLTQREQYHYVQAQYGVEQTRILQQIEYVKGLEPDEEVTFRTGEKLTREEALKKLEEQRKMVISGRTQIREYQQLGYRIKREGKGGFVFHKIVETKPISKADDSEKEWHEWHSKALKEKPVETRARDISYSFLKIFDPGTWAAAWRGELPEYLHREDIKNIKDIHKGKGWEVWARIQAPAYEQVIIPAAAAVVLTPVVGAIGK